MSEREIMSSKEYSRTSRKSDLGVNTYKYHSTGRTRPIATLTPHPKKHQIISFIKSGIRIIGYGFLVVDPVTAIVILVASEVVGIIEEMV